MRITAIKRVPINGVKLKIGIHNYDFDHKDPMTAMQLRILRAQKVIKFTEWLPGDSDNGPAHMDPNSEYVKKAAETKAANEKRTKAKLAAMKKKSEEKPVARSRRTNKKSEKA